MTIDPRRMIKLLLPSFEHGINSLKSEDEFHRAILCHYTSYKLKKTNKDRESDDSSPPSFLHSIMIINKTVKNTPRLGVQFRNIVFLPFPFSGTRQRLITWKKDVTTCSKERFLFQLIFWVKVGIINTCMLCFDVLTLYILFQLSV